MVKSFYRQKIEEFLSQTEQEVKNKILKSLPKKIVDERYELHDKEGTDLLIMISKSKAGVYHNYLYEKVGFNRCLKEITDLIK